MIIGTILTLLVAIEHIYILVLEMFLWTEKRTRAIFGITAEVAEVSKTLAANQGLYNGFLAAGLIFGAFSGNSDVGFAFKVFFLICVVIAGIYGGATAKPRIFLVQGLPALIALIVVVLTG